MLVLMVRLLQDVLRGRQCGCVLLYEKYSTAIVKRRPDPGNRGRRLTRHDTTRHLGTDTQGQSKGVRDNKIKFPSSMRRNPPPCRADDAGPEPDLTWTTPGLTRGATATGLARAAGQGRVWVLTSGPALGERGEPEPEPDGGHTGARPHFGCNASSRLTRLAPDEA